MFSDPSGKLVFWFIAGAIIGAYIGGSAANHWKWNPVKWNFQNSDTWAYMAFGAIVGGFGGQLLLGPGGIIAGGSQLGVSIGAFVGNTFSAFATFAVSSSGVILQGVGYVTAAGGGVYVTLNQKLWNWDSGKKGKPEPKNYVETGSSQTGSEIKLSGGSLTQPTFFSNTKDAYRFMWDNSFDANMNASVETSAWIIRNGDRQGIIVMPNVCNGLRFCYNDYLLVRYIGKTPQVRYDGFGGGWFDITGHIHTHPSYNDGFIGISNADRQMSLYLGKGIYVLWNNRVWIIEGNSNPVYVGKW